MPEVLKIGPLMVKTDWLIIALAVILGFQAVKWKLKSVPEARPKILDGLTTGAILIVLVWKFGPLLFSPSLFWNDPSSILIVSGRMTHFWIGLGLAAVYLGFKMKKSHISFMILLDVLPYGYLLGFLIDRLLIGDYGYPTTLPWAISIRDPAYTYHPINLYDVAVTLPLLIWLWKKNSPLGKGTTFSLYIAYYGLGQFFVSFFYPQTIRFLGLSAWQMVCLGAWGIGTWMASREHVRTIDLPKVEDQN